MQLLSCKWMLRSLLAIGALAAMPHSASADISWSDNFDSYTVNSNTWVDNTAWTKTTNYANQSVAMAAGTSSFAPTGTQVWRLYDTTTSGLPYARVDMTSTSFGLPLTSTSSLHIEFDFMSSTANSGYAPNFQMVLRASPTNSGTQGAVLRLDNGGKMTYVIGSGETELYSSITRGTWYHITLQIDTINSVTDKYTLTVQPFGGAVDTFPNLAFRNDIATYGALEFNQNSTSNTGEFFLDNLVISTAVPEPASMGMLALAGLLLRRRCK